MAKESFENKMLNSIYETDKPRMQFLLDNKALTLSVVKYIERHMRFVSTRCIDNEKHWQVLYNFSDFLELKKVHEQIKQKQESGEEQGLPELKQKFEEIKKKFDVSNSEHVLTAKRYEQEWTEFLQYCLITSKIEESINPTQQTSNLPQIIKQWAQLTNPTTLELANLIEQTHLAYLSDNGLQGFGLEVTEGNGLKGVISEQKLYVGEDLLKGNNSTADYLTLLSKVLSASELVTLSTKLNKPLKGVNPLNQAMMYERAISIVNAIRQNKFVTNSEQLNALLTLNSANLINTYGGEAGSNYYKQVVSTLPNIQLTQNEPVRIVEEYYESFLPKMQQGVTKLIAQSKKQAGLIK